VSGVRDLIGKLIEETRARHPDRPALIGVGGAQGSGKSHQCRAYAAAHVGVAHFSLDDVYLTKAERQARADIFADDLPPDDTYPNQKLMSASERARLKELYLTRGPPGTHNIGLAGGLIARLRGALPTPLPRFDKSKDDRALAETWPTFQGPAEAVLIDGWCMGALPPDEGPAINEVEALDVKITWRESSWLSWQSSVRSELDGAYAQFFAAFDALIYLQAPNWEIVRTWRGQQEEQTLGRPLTADENAALDRFVMHYERVTRAMLAGHHRARWVVHLDEARNVVRIEER